MNARKVLLTAVLALFVAVPFAFATGGGGGYHCDGDCGAEVEVKFYFDENQNGRFNSATDGWMEGHAVSIYNEGWAYMATQIVGRGDGILNNNSDRGRTTFRGLRPDNEGYIVCAHGFEGFFTQPTASSSDPSSRVHVVERLSVNDDQSRYCYRVELQNDCSDETVWFGFYSDIE